MAVVRVSRFVAAVKRVTVALVQWRSDSEAVRKIWVRDEGSPERYQIRIACLEDCFSGLSCKAASRDDRAGEFRSKMLSSDRLLACTNQFGALDPGLDNVKVR